MRLRQDNSRLIFVPSLLVLAILLLSASAALAQVDSPPPPPPPLGDEPPPPATTAPPPATTAPGEQPAQAQAQPAGSGFASAPDTSPVVRADSGNIGLFFRFGGLSTMTATGNENYNRAVIVTTAGLKLVFSEKFMLPLYFGTKIDVTGLSDIKSSPANESDTSTDWGLEMGAGFEYHFRIWRRLSPYFAADMAFGFADLSGSDNLQFGLTVGPRIGVEYYIGDRVSLSAEYLFLIELLYKDADTDVTQSETDFIMATQSGGAMRLTYYF